MVSHVKCFVLNTKPFHMHRWYGNDTDKVQYVCLGRALLKDIVNWKIIWRIMWTGRQFFACWGRHPNVGHSCEVFGTLWLCVRRHVSLLRLYSRWTGRVCGDSNCCGTRSEIAPDLDCKLYMYMEHCHPLDWDSSFPVFACCVLCCAKCRCGCFLTAALVGVGLCAVRISNRSFRCESCVTDMHPGSNVCCVWKEVLDLCCNVGYNVLSDVHGVLHIVL